MSGEFSTAPTEALVGPARNRLREVAALDRIRVAVASARVPDWAFGDLEQATRWRDLVDVSFRECERELLSLRGSLGSTALDSIDSDHDAGSRDRSPSGSADSLSPTSATVNPKATMVDHVVELPGWREATYRYIDVDGCGFDVPAPGLPPVRVGVVTEAAFHDFRIGTESDDHLECALARHGHQLEEAELVGRAMGSRLRVLGEFIIPLWLSSPDAIGVAAERLSVVLGELDTECGDHPHDAFTTPHVSGDSTRPDGHPGRSGEYFGVRRRLTELMGHLDLMATDLKRARNRCAAIIVEHQAAIIAARERVLRESTGHGDDDSVDVNPASALLSGYESAVLAMNDTIATTVMPGLGRRLNPTPPGPAGLTEDDVMDRPSESSDATRFPR